MITKERLEELIEQGATIYDISSKTYLGQRKLNRFAWIDDNCLCFNKSEYPEMAYLQDLFETEEDARWELEMTATRTETLKLPTYEKVFEQDRCLDCYTKEFAITKTDIVIGICLFGVDFTNKVVEVSVGADKMFVGELTKENYIEACKLCLRLFKGEEV